MGGTRERVDTCIYPTCVSGKGFRIGADRCVAIPQGGKDDRVRRYRSWAHHVGGRASFEGSKGRISA